MKKLILAASLMALGSGSALAASLYSAAIGTDQFTTADCPDHLADNPKFTLSANVLMGASCILTAGVINGISLASCHTSGLTKSRSVKVACDDDVVNGVTATVPACDGSDTNTPSGAASGFNLITTTGASIFGGATSGGGSLANLVTAGATCTAPGASVKAAAAAY